MIEQQGYQFPLLADFWPHGAVAQAYGVFNSDRGNLHAFHTDKIERIRCNWCHVAVPHGWKNKALLVNLNDVGEEAGQPPAVRSREPQ